MKGKCLGRLSGSLHVFVFHYFKFDPRVLSCILKIKEFCNLQLKISTINSLDELSVIHNMNLKLLSFFFFLSPLCDM